MKQIIYEMVLYKVDALQKKPPYQLQVEQHKNNPHWDNIELPQYIFYYKTNYQITFNTQSTNKSVVFNCHLGEKKMKNLPVSQKFMMVTKKK